MEMRHAKGLWRATDLDAFANHGSSVPPFVGAAEAATRASSFCAHIGTALRRDRPLRERMRRSTATRVPRPRRLCACVRNISRTLYGGIPVDGDDPMKYARRAACGLAMFVVVAAAGGLPAATESLVPSSIVANSAPATHEAEAASSAVILLDGVVDDTPDALFADRVRVDLVGCADLADRDCKRLANFRIEIAWESATQLAERLERAHALTEAGARSGLELESIAWEAVRSDAQGRAALPLPREADAANVLHVRLLEPGWEGYTFPGAVHPGTRDGAAAFELARGARQLRLTLVRARPQLPP
jgi:hypothetical protein